MSQPETAERSHQPTTFTDEDKFVTALTEALQVANGDLNQVANFTFDTGKTIRQGWNLNRIDKFTQQVEDITNLLVQAAQTNIRTGGTEDDFSIKGSVALRDVETHISIAMLFAPDASNEKATRYKWGFSKVKNLLTTDEDGNAILKPLNIEKVPFSKWGPPVINSFILAACGVKAGDVISTQQPTIDPTEPPAISESLPKPTEAAASPTVVAPSEIPTPKSGVEIQFITADSIENSERFKSQFLAEREASADILGLQFEIEGTNYQSIFAQVTDGENAGLYTYVPDATDGTLFKPLEWEISGSGDQLSLGYQYSFSATSGDFPAFQRVFVGPNTGTIPWPDETELQFYPGSAFALGEPGIAPPYLETSAVKLASLKFDLAPEPIPPPPPIELENMTQIGTIPLFSPEVFEEFWPITRAYELGVEIPITATTFPQINFSMQAGAAEQLGFSSFTTPDLNPENRGGIQNAINITLSLSRYEGTDRYNANILFFESLAQGKPLPLEVLVDWPEPSVQTADLAKGININCITWQEAINDPTFLHGFTPLVGEEDDGYYYRTRVEDGVLTHDIAIKNFNAWIKELTDEGFPADGAPKVLLHNVLFFPLWRALQPPDHPLPPDYFDMRATGRPNVKDHGYDLRFKSWKNFRTLLIAYPKRQLLVFTK